MKIIDFSIIGLLFIPVIFFISRKALRERKTFLIILGFSLFFSCIGLTSLLDALIDNPNFNLYWFCPIYSLLLYRLMLIPFWVRKKRDPKIPPRELFYSGNTENFIDQLFGFAFLILSILIPMVIVVNF